MLRSILFPVLIYLGFVSSFLIFLQLYPPRKRVLYDQTHHRICTRETQQSSNITLETMCSATGILTHFVVLLVKTFLLTLLKFRASYRWTLLLTIFQQISCN